MDKNIELEESFLGSVEAGKSLPTDTLPEEPMDADIAEQLVQHYRLNEAKANQNLATFCTTQMEPQADRLMTDALNTNAIDKSEYPKTAAMESYCVSMIAHLWHVGEGKKMYKDFIGTSTVGSSEGCMLGGLALLMSWKNRAKAAGFDIEDLHVHKPNLVIMSGYQVVWEKFCTYWNVDMRQVPIDQNHMSLDTDHVMDYVDDNTIGIIGIQGITYTGAVDDIEKLDQLVTEYNKTATLPVRIHVDAAFGGLFAPFVDGFKPWDFRLKNVVSINVSGHKYGMVYPGIGWVVWRENTTDVLPKEMRFEVAYLGDKVDSIAINFSHSGAHITGQYYNFIRFGLTGYKAIMNNVRKVSLKLTDELKKFGIFEILNDGSQLPINCWKLKDGLDQNWDLYDLEDALAKYGWQVPAYPLPKDRDDVIISRIVVRPSMTMTIADDFIDDLKLAINNLNKAKLVHSDPETVKMTDTVASH
ncbi:glutamate decarboxylase [Furfurilactobacillus rossiae]|uniref:Glutamate decarboxylase n=1 Tax=Furfurilactobacillus rossiae DSM 15814 TaxID=1114972 RepID=A0A0R1RHT1_9LACO|nr:glutamate decarboxylase [Furfurilactobacillus rossiae]KRL56399.1 glutamate decarboxylase [Furfurilactobacillus rossiae DSM 15814]QFR67905.1 glutamate decarboxylase [Furfurilactobacillus rossiae]QLE60891.1 Glutamate decarboxylase [Furfurilactobacillus rossiae]